MASPFLIEDRQIHRVDADVVRVVSAPVLAHAKQALTRVWASADQQWTQRVRGSSCEPGDSAGLIAWRQGRALFENEVLARLEQRFTRLYEQGHDAPALTTREAERSSESASASAAIQRIESLHGDALRDLGRRLAVAVDRPTLEGVDLPLSAHAWVEAVQWAQVPLILPPLLRRMVFSLAAQAWSESLPSLLVELSGRLDAAVMKEGSPLPAPNEGDTELFGVLCDLLRDFEPGFGPPSVEPPSPTVVPFRAPVGRQEVMASLQPLQREPAPALRQAFDGPVVELGYRLKQELMLALTDPAVPGPLSPEDERAVDRVGVLFEETVLHGDFEARSRSTLSRLVVPCLKAAVLDRGPFQDTAHPARRLLRSVAEAIQGTDHTEVVSKAEAAVDRVVTEFNEDMAILNVIEQELRRFLEQWQARQSVPAQVPLTLTPVSPEHQRQAEIRATRALLERTAGVALPKAIDAFLAGPWHRHLVRLAMNEAFDADAWQESLSLADRLVPLWGAQAPSRPEAATVLTRLFLALSAVWREDGAADEAIAVHQQAFEAALDETIRPREATAIQRLSVTPAGVERPLDPEARKRVAGLRLGDWIELSGADGKKEPAKLSWISPISSRWMFVNARGLRVLVASPDELARLMTDGKMTMA